MVKQVIIPKVPQYLEEPLKEGIRMGTEFVYEKYGKETFTDCVLLVRPDARNGCYYSNLSPHPKFETNPVAIISCRTHLYLYEKKRLGKYKQGLCVGYEICCATCVVHELTHHAQFKRDRSSGELETTANEIEFIRKHHPYWYDMLMIEEPKNSKKMERKKFSSQVSPKRKRILELYSKINELDQAILKAEKSKLYTLRWEGKVETLHSIQRIVQKYKDDVNEIRNEN